MSATITPPRSRTPVRGSGFAPVLRAEWVKFRTVRGWVIGMIIAALVTVGIALLDHSQCGGQVTPGGPSVVGAGCSVPIGPGGAAVSDSFYFAHRPLAGNGSITARITSLTLPGGNGPARLQPWSKAGIIIKASTRPGSAYAAMLVTPGHGIRMQYDFTGGYRRAARGGLPGRATLAAADPLRRHDHRVRLGRRRALDQSRPRAPGRPGQPPRRLGCSPPLRVPPFPAASRSPGRARAARSPWPPATSTTSRSAGTPPATAGPAPRSAAAHQAPGSTRPTARSR